MSSSDDHTVPDISELRQSIDRVDRSLLDLIAERLELADLVRRAKSGARVWRPAREQALIRKLADISPDTPHLLVSRIWAELISASLALQGPMQLHVSLEGDAVDVREMVRDRFGAALPLIQYPTASSALAGAYSDPEGVAIVASPEGMHRWWTALAPDGAMPDMRILAGLPRVRNELWPSAVAVSTSDMEYETSDNLLLCLTDTDLFHDHNLAGVLKAEAGDKKLILLEAGWDEDVLNRYLSHDLAGTVIGYLSQPLQS